MGKKKARKPINSEKDKPREAKRHLTEATPIDLYNGVIRLGFPRTYLEQDPGEDKKQREDRLFRYIRSIHEPNGPKEISLFAPEYLKRMFSKKPFNAEHKEFGTLNQFLITLAGALLLDSKFNPREIYFANLNASSPKLKFSSFPGLYTRGGTYEYFLYEFSTFSLSVGTVAGKPHIKEDNKPQQDYLLMYQEYEIRLATQFGVLVLKIQGPEILLPAQVNFHRSRAHELYMLANETILLPLNQSASAEFGILTEEDFGATAYRILASSDPAVRPHVVIFNLISFALMAKEKHTLLNQSHSDLEDPFNPVGRIHPAIRRANARKNPNPHSSNLDIDLAYKYLVEMLKGATQGIFDVRLLQPNSQPFTTSVPNLIEVNPINVTRLYWALFGK